MTNSSLGLHAHHAAWTRQMLNQKDVIPPEAGPSQPERGRSRSFPSARLCSEKPSITRRHQTCHFRKRATSLPAEGPAYRLDFARHCHCGYLFELCRRRSGTLTEVSRLVPPGAPATRPRTRSSLLGSGSRATRRGLAPQVLLLIIIIIHVYMYMYIYIYIYIYFCEAGTLWCPRFWHILCCKRCFHLHESTCFERHVLSCRREHHFMT